MSANNNPASWKCRGIGSPFMKDVSSKMNTGGKYDSKAFKKSVGLNGAGIKAVNALSSSFFIQSYRDGMSNSVSYACGEVVSESGLMPTDEPNGTLVQFSPDGTIFKNYAYREELIEPLLKNYVFLNTGLTILLNGRKFHSRNGLVDLLNEYMTTEPLYPIIHLSGVDIEVVITHSNQYGEEYYSFVNGQHTTQGGTHQSAFKKHIAETIKDFSGKNFDYGDIRNGLVAAIAVNIEEPLFESQTKIKLGSLTTIPDGGISIDKFVGDFVKEQVDNYLHKNTDIADIIIQKITENEKERKAIAGVTKLARERAKKANLHNRKLRDCRIHLNDAKGDLKEDSSIFITEGDSASGSITKSRDVTTQAVFSLRGKPLNCFGLTKKVVYENEEFNLLQAALNIEDGLDGLRYNKVIVATDADVDGMHIRLLMITFFLQFFPELIKKGHVYILQTPLFRVRNRKNKIGKQKLKELEEEGKGAVVYGRDIVTGLPVEREIPTRMVDESLEEHFNTIIDNVKVILERTPPELAADIYRHGIYLTGGASQVSHLAERLATGTGLHVNVAENPLTSVATGLAIKDDNYKTVAYAIEGMSK